MPLRSRPPRTDEGPSLLLVYLVPAALASVPAGVLSDRVGCKRLVVVATALVGLGGPVIALVPTFGTMLVVRVVQGTCYGILQTMTINIIGELRRGPALAGAQGLRSVTLALGGAVLPAVGGFLVLVHWRVGSGVQAVCLVLAWLLHRRLPESAPEPAEPAAVDDAPVSRAGRVVSERPGDDPRTSEREEGGHER